MKEDQPSSTAFTVLQGLIYISNTQEHGYLVPKDMVPVATQILQSCKEGQKRLKQINSPLASMSVKLREYLMLPGITLHYILRKNYIEDKTRAAIADGVTQVVNLGAGFDTLAWRLCQLNPRVNFIEIDRPATQNIKTNALLTVDSPAPENMHFLGVDTTIDDLRTILAEFAPFEADRPTLYICEGMMMYLEEPGIHRVFDTINALSGAGTQLLFTFLEPEGTEKNNLRGLLFNYLRIIGEPIMWSLESENVAAFLQNRECELLELVATDELKQLYIKKETDYTFHHGEYIVLAKTQ